MSAYVIDAWIDEESSFHGDKVYFIGVKIKRRFFGTKTLYLNKWVSFANNDGGFIEEVTFRNRGEAENLVQMLKSGKAKVSHDGLWLREPKLYY